MTAAVIRQSLIVFARAPRPGHVKTRLVSHLGADGAANLYHALLQRTLKTAMQLPATQVVLYVADDAAHASLIELQQRYGIDLRLQQGEDLGQRMQHALREALIEYPRAVLIGTDTPGYSVPYLHAAFAALGAHNVVIGPAEDGGYVLIGAAHHAPAIFEGVAWGSERVLAQTRNLLRRHNYAWHELAPLWDVDTAADLRRLQALPELHELIR